MKKRNMAFVIIMWIIFPIYALYWYCSFQNQLKKATGLGFGGFGHLMATIFSFGIYNWVWCYKVGGRLEKLGGKDNGAAYLILAILGFGFIAYWIMQSQANKLEEPKEQPRQITE